MLIEVFAELVREMVVLEPRGLERDILELAASKGVTAYDASYIALAAKHGLTLVTEDQKLARAARGPVEVVSLDSLT